MNNWTETEDDLHDSQRAALDAFTAAMAQSGAQSGYSMISIPELTNQGTGDKSSLCLVVVANEAAVKSIWEFVEMLNKTQRFGQKQKLFKEELSGVFTVEEFTTEDHHV